MESVKRYDIDGRDWDLLEATDGDWVSASDFDRVIAERNALQLMLNDREEQNHSLEQRRHAEQQACQAAERRVKELEAEVGRLNRVKMALAEKAGVHSDNCSVYRVGITERDELLNLALTMINRGIVSFDDQIEYRQKFAALNPTAEAVIHEA